MERADRSRGSSVADEWQANPLSAMTWTWIAKLLKVGKQRPLQFEDLGWLDYGDRSAALADALERKAATASGSPRRKMITALLALDECNVVGAGICKLIGDLLGFVGPVALAGIVRFVRVRAAGGTDERWGNLELGYWWLLASFVSAILQNMLLQHHHQMVMRAGIRARAAVSLQVYRKSLRMDPAVRNRIGSGAIQNRQSSDANNINLGFWMIHYVWAAPLQLAISMAMLYQQLGASAFVALGVLIAVIPVQGRIAKLTAAFARDTMTHSDSRLRLVTETVTGIKIIKLFAFENDFIRRITGARDSELAVKRRTAGIAALNSTILSAVPLLVALLTFLCYGYVSPTPLTAERAFASMTLFTILRLPLFIFPMLVGSLTTMKVASDRVADFLAEPDADDYRTIEAMPTATGTARLPPAVQFSHANLRWAAAADKAPSGGAAAATAPATAGTPAAVVTANPVVAVAAAAKSPATSPASDQPVFALTDITVAFPTGKLTQIAGAVGSGKSSLLSAILGELRLSSGNVTLRVPPPPPEDAAAAAAALPLGATAISVLANSANGIAFCSQQPWILNASVRDNITFGETFDAARYEQALQVCALQPDLRILPAGDATEIGERGVNLSGGQKARISLARAVYSRASLVLLDDVLSAVDAHVARHIFTHAITGALLGRTVIMASHQLQFLPACDLIVIMDNGRIAQCGTYAKLMEEGDAQGVGNGVDKGVATGRNLLADMMEERRRVDDALAAATTAAVAAVTTSTIVASTTAAAAAVLPPADAGAGVGVGAGAAPHVTATAPTQGDRPLPALPPIAAAAGDGSSGSPTGDTPAPASPAALATAAAAAAASAGVAGLSSPATTMATPSAAAVVPVVPPTTAAAAAKPTDAAAAAAAAASGKLITTEDRNTGGVPLKTYTGYLLAFPGAALAIMLITLAAVNAGNVGTDYWLAYWADDRAKQGIGYYVGCYAAISVATALLAGAQMLTWAIGGIAAARRLHGSMLHRVIRAPMAFFDATPVGRIINRFSGDVNTVDKDLPTAFQNYLNLLVRLVATIIAMAIVLPWILLALIPLVAAYYYVQDYYRHSSRELKRLDNISKSPVFAHLTETLSGLPTIRAYGLQARFAETSEARIDKNSLAYLKLNLINRWLGLRLDWTGAMLVGVTSLVAVMTAGSAEPGPVGLALSYAMSLTSQLNWMVRSSTETETYLASVERIEYYSQLQVERPPVVADHRPPPDWPNAGAITFDNVTITYREDLAPVLADVTLDIRPGEKIGVVGRTGAGKSSMMLALFRILEAKAGRITVDGIDIASIGLDDLRSRIAIIPQDPTLFSGTLRYNLDPTHKHESEELWQALAAVHLDAYVREQTGQLDMAIAENGENLSVGQRQLLCMARALLRKARIMVLDEATASTDVRSDAVIQSRLRDLVGVTQLTIAHRLNTVMDASRVLVLDKGRVREFDTPAALLADPTSAFYSLVHDAAAESGSEAADAAASAPPTVPAAASAAAAGASVTSVPAADGSAAEVAAAPAAAAPAAADPDEAAAV